MNMIMDFYGLKMQTYLWNNVVCFVLFRQTKIS